MKKSWRRAERRTIYSKSRRRTGVWEWWRIGKATFRRRENLLKKHWQSAASSTTNMESPSPLNFLGELARTEGDDAAAGALFKESLETFRQLGNKEAVGANLANLGAIAFGEGDFAAARSNFAEGLAMAQKMGSNIHISFPLDGFAALAARRGELERAAQLAGAAEHLRESIGYEIEPADRRFRDAYTSELKTKMSEEEFTKAYEQGRKLKLDEAIALALD